jgi:hypothetical protein
MMKGGRTGWDLAQEWLIKDAWKSSCRAPCRNVGALRQARAHNYLPALSIPHSAVVCTLPGMRCKAGLKGDESLKRTATRASTEHHCNVEKRDHQRLQTGMKSHFHLQVSVPSALSPTSFLSKFVKVPLTCNTLVCSVVQPPSGNCRRRSSLAARSCHSAAVRGVPS